MAATQAEQRRRYIGGGFSAPDATVAWAQVNVSKEATWLVHLVGTAGSILSASVSGTALTA